MRRMRPYKGGGVMLLRKGEKEYEVLLGKRAVKKDEGKWSLFGGRLEGGDRDLQVTGLRELREELGVDLTRFQKTLPLGKSSIHIPFFHWETWYYLVREDIPLDKYNWENSAVEWIPLSSIQGYEVVPLVHGELRKARALLQKNERQEEEALYHAAKRIVLKVHNASALYLQKEMGIGFNQAAKLLERMEKEGIIGPANGSKKREILI